MALTLGDVNDEIGRLLDADDVGAITRRFLSVI
jgi:hypothetical protein